MVKKVYRKKKTTTTLAKQVATIKRLVKARVPEKKHYDTGATGQLIDNNPSFCLFPTRQISQGTSDFGNRIGDKYQQKRFQMRGDIFLSAASPGARVRFIAFVYKRNPDQVVSSFATVINLYLASATMNTVTAPLAFLEWDNNKSFTTLYDKTHIINASDSAVVERKKIDFNVNIPKSCQQVAFSASSVFPTQNELYVCAISSSDVAVYLDYQYRYVYTDP